MSCCIVISYAKIVNIPQKQLGIFHNIIFHSCILQLACLVTRKMENANTPDAGLLNTSHIQTALLYVAKAAR